jgi:hydrogenase maturation protease
MRVPLLIAGIGNIFLGDDGFGVAVVQRLRARSLPPGTRSIDFGIRGRELGYALKSCDAAILIDATERGGPPGTLYVIEPRLDQPPDSGSPADAHTLTPHRVLAALPQQDRPRVLRLVGCEPLSCEPLPPDDTETPEGMFALSHPVQKAVEQAVLLVEKLAAQLLAQTGEPHA